MTIAIERKERDIKQTPEFKAGYRLGRLSMLAELNAEMDAKNNMMCNDLFDEDQNKLKES